jgi:uncharacterized membrane protein YjjB (DUF3815 family)
MTSFPSGAFCAGNEVEINIAKIKQMSQFLVTMPAILPLVPGRRDAYATASLTPLAPRTYTQFQRAIPSSVAPPK